MGEQTPPPQSRKLCVVLPHTANLQCTKALGKADTKATPAFPSVVRYRHCEWWLGLLVRLCLQPNLTNAKCWHWLAMPNCPYIPFVLGKEKHGCGLFPAQRGASCLRYSWPSFLSGRTYTSSDTFQPSGSLVIHQCRGHHPHKEHLRLCLASNTLDF